SSGNHRDARKVAGVTANCNKPAAHGAADLVAGAPIDENDPAAHAEAAATVRGANKVARIAVHVDATTMHLRPHPVARVAVHLDFATDHFRAEVHANVAVYRDPTVCHAGADPFDAAAITLNDDFLIAGVPFDREELGERHLRVAMLHWKVFNVRGGLAGEIVRLRHSASTGIVVVALYVNRNMARLTFRPRACAS